MPLTPSSTPSPHAGRNVPIPPADVRRPVHPAGAQRTSSPRGLRVQAAADHGDHHGRHSQHPQGRQPPRQRGRGRYRRRPRPHLAGMLASVALALIASLALTAALSTRKTRRDATYQVLKLLLVDVRHRSSPKHTESIGGPRPMRRATKGSDGSHRRRVSAARELDEDTLDPAPPHPGRRPPRHLHLRQQPRRRSARAGQTFKGATGVSR